MRLFLLLLITLAISLGGTITVQPTTLTEGLTREALLLQLRARFSQLKSYQCSMCLDSYENGHKLQTQRFWYKVPGYKRIEQTGPFRKGAVVVIRPDGTIRAHLGGVLSFLTIPLQPDDPRLLGVTNDSALTADYGSIIQAALDSSPTIARYTLRQGIEEGHTVIILESFVAGPIDLYKMTIDPGEMVILRLERYAQTRLLYRVSWRDIRLNSELSDSLFQQ